MIEEKHPAAGGKELSYTGMRRRGVPSGTGYAGYRKARRPAPLSPMMRDVLRALEAGCDRLGMYGMTGNEIGYAIGAATVKGGRGMGGRGRGSRVFGPAQRIIPCLIGLSKRGLIVMAKREDRRSGTAYRLTQLGHEEVAKMGTDEVYEMENVEPLGDREAEFGVGGVVEVDDGHEVYPGETGKVVGVGIGTGQYAGSIVYDVLIDGTSEPDRFAEEELV